MLSRVSEKARYIWSVEKTNSNPYDRNQFTCLSNSATGKLANTSPRCNVLFPSCSGRAGGSLSPVTWGWKLFRPVIIMSRVDALPLQGLSRLFPPLSQKHRPFSIPSSISTTSMRIQLAGSFTTKHVLFGKKIGGFLLYAASQATPGCHGPGL